MTFDEVCKLIRRDGRIQLRHALEQGLNPNLANKYGWTILMCTAMKGDVTIGRMLIEHGAELDTRNKFRATALSLAIQSGHAPFVDLLLKNGASKVCYPHCNSLEIFLEWAQEYCSCSATSMTKIRRLLDEPETAKGEIRI